MPEGITILYQEPITKIPMWFWTSYIICLILILIGFILTFINLRFFGTLLAIIPAFIMIALSFFLPLIQDKFEAPTGQYEYQILIDDNEDFKKIYDKYEIIDAKGEIYIIRDKEYE